MMRRIPWLVAAALVAVPATAPGQGGGGPEIDFGDMIHVLRDFDSARPILQMRWIEYPGDVFGWGYCPIPVTADGAEIPFVELSCDPDPLYDDQILEVDLGRLNGARTQERTIRMHYNEVITNIQKASVVDLDEALRLKLGFNCFSPAPTSGRGLVDEMPWVCGSWKVIDSPMENLSLYQRILKYGHIQTDPLELDPWSHGDPSLPPAYHPALRAVDWAKFSKRVVHLLPMGSEPDSVRIGFRPYAARTSTSAKAASPNAVSPVVCFGEAWPDGFNPVCKDPELLSSDDHLSASSTLGGAADKDGRIGGDVLAYLNRILRVPVETDSLAAPLSVRPALIRLEDLKTIIEAPPGLPEPADEMFVDFRSVYYRRSDSRDQLFRSLKPLGGGIWIEEPAVPLLAWLEFINGPEPAGYLSDAPGFIASSSDALRCVEFIHNYEVPADLGWDFDY
jgi:hypothetical protein